MKPRRVFIVAAEPSGDELAGELVAALRRVEPTLELAGVGGAKLASHGVISEVSIEGLSVLGLTEGLSALRTVRRRALETSEAARRFTPDAVVFIDSWGFTLRAAKAIRALLPNAVLIKMVGPQVFASRPGRAKTVAQVYDALFCIHDFEVPYYDGTGLPITVIGNPAIARSKPGNATQFRQRHGLKDKRVVLLLPGSRAGEIKRVAPALEGAAALLSAADPSVEVVVVLAPSVEEQIRARAATWTFKHHLVGEAEKCDAFAAGDVALACSGTVTTEVALQGTPMVLGYRLGAISAFILLKFLLKSRYICLLNIALNRMAIPEFLQDELTPQNIAQAASILLYDPKSAQVQRDQQALALEKMGGSHAPAPQRAAEALVALLNKQNKDDPQSNNRP
ncbi:lipid-A-disaccharide synthase [Candidatus Phycosocius spiralis]|uniref:Lipid-A-disaccharide synthase n=1 Tax=Candidatus Phycosocius spiralis TaxID=2815099 RepID=A0ABQ4PT14_9PROT|nr:lipid-A-disaccharide synthase [Candidatus Phycosocius spiralis]GIU66113.1 lipid-A-disaccharide synthase [Candidatus Phycosocius spiralis]